MGLQVRDVALIIFVSFLAWAYASTWLPTLQWVGYAFAAGVVLTLLLLLAAVLLVSRGSRYAHRHDVRRPRGPAFLGAAAWRAEVAGLRSRQRYTKQPLFPQSAAVSAALDEVLGLVVRDYVHSWYAGISADPAPAHAVDRLLRQALLGLAGRLRAAPAGADPVEAVTTRLVPLLTAHLRDFAAAERAVRGRDLARAVTESGELDRAVAGRYRAGRPLHPAAALRFADPRPLQQEHLRAVAARLLRRVLPARALASRAVAVLAREVVACAVLLPAMQLLSEPDTYNQILEAYGRSVLRDRSTVRRLRAALDEHASPAPRDCKRGAAFPRLGPNESERSFERFVRAIGKVNNISDARRFRSDVSSQLKRDAAEESRDPVYLRRLEIGRKLLDQKVNQLAAGSQQSSSVVELSRSRDATASRVDITSLLDLLHDSSGLSYFMEYMDRQHLMPMIQFWIVVDGFRNPLEDDIADEEMAATPPPWTESDRADLAQIYEAYLTRSEMKVPEQSKKAVRTFLRAGRDATPQEYYLARKATLLAQTAVLEEMQELHFPNFRKSDLYYKCLTSQEAQKSHQAKAPPQLSFGSVVKQPPGRSSSAQPLPPRPELVARASSKAMPKRSEPRRGGSQAASSSSAGGRPIDGLTKSRRSLDEEAAPPLFDDEDIDSEGMNGSVHSLDQGADGHAEAPDNQVVEAMEAALNTIMEDTSDVHDLRNSIFGPDSPNPSLLSAQDNDSKRGSMDMQRADPFLREIEKPSISSLGLVNTSSRIGVFTDDDLFGDEEKFLSDEREDDDDDVDDNLDEEIHEAAPGDLGLAEAITHLTGDIDRLSAQDAVVDSLTRKAELTNNTAELRILRKSKASLQREMRRKELQRQQYVVQESDNSLYGRSTVRITSIMVGREDDNVGGSGGSGAEYAVYVVEVQRRAGEQMAAATWTITRRYSEFHDLHRRLRARHASVRALDFPRRRVVMKLQRDFLQKRRVALERYVRALLELPDVCRSRELRAFLSQKIIAPLGGGVGGEGRWHGSEDGGGGGGSGGSDKNQQQQQQQQQDMVTRFYNSVTDGMDDLLGNIPILDQLSVTGQNLLSAATSHLSAANNNNNNNNNSTTTSSGAAAIISASADPLTAAEAEAELNAFEDRELEPFVKPICDVFLELFELNRGNNWLRGRAVVVVLHQLLGGAIERKVREAVRGLVQEEAVLRYVTLLRDAMWPAASSSGGGGDGGGGEEGGGQGQGQGKGQDQGQGQGQGQGQTRQVNGDGGKPKRSAAEKSKSRTEAGLVLATLVPDLAGSVVGRANAKAASRRILATFNNERLNSHLVFTLLDEIIEILFEERT